MQRAFLMTMLGLGLVLAAAACGTTEKASTVDEAVTLLQDVENNALWASLEDGLDALNEQVGFRAHLTVETAESTVEWSIQADSERAMQIDVQRDQTTERYYLPASATASESHTVVRLEGERAACEVSEPDAVPLHDGLTGVLADAVAALSSEHLLAVIDTPEETGDLTVLGREAVRYDVESRYDEALSLANDVNNGTSRPSMKEDATLTGVLILDRETAALLEFSGTLGASSNEPAVQVNFAILEWGVDPITSPIGLDNLAPCP